MPVASRRPRRRGFDRFTQSWSGRCGCGLRVQVVPSDDVDDKPRPCERYCPNCERWKHHSRFRSFDRKTGHGTVSKDFKRICKDCEQIQRVARKNEDRPLAIIRKRAADHAHRADMPVEFFWVNMNYRALVPYYRAALSSEGLCLSCGHPYDDEKDIQIEHRAPPRHRHDFARLHARNLALACANCNGTKTSKDYDDWLDDCEETRLTNEAHRAAGLGGKDRTPPDWEQETLF